MNLYYSLLKNRNQQINEVDIVDACLLRFAEKTTIKVNDSEQEAVLKLRCRIKACLIAQKLYKKGFDGLGVNKWKMISQSKDEFIELRRNCINMLKRF